ncbi:MAG: CBS domain-containing protein [Sulfobacillus thermosulfidooxidans]|uniref:CBS domain-containing protein n=1 Tax=Sulfobacillus thermotolerans TaxID=338644 RepID=A0ABN5GZ97_9FIRM|nr:CBS domain-containing protein [Sulfobacillus sp. hq2]AUW93867.1 CBS domain-containing protein [Sulfobacillus thermotolerans]MCY0907919.1 CBS domain-containing protein [Sulfobacillus thermotolerans]POB11319.1 CBS domain-containing protein [Sulfobacillus sp. hq2]PSR38018.1 MAG: CBS domain-containing protein [Sulfobacillus thermosulfidooxidans]
MKVKDIMTHKVSTVAPSDSIEHAAKIMKQLHCGSTPVVEGGKVVGIITDRDISIKAVAEGKGPNTAVKDIMFTQVVTCTPETDARQAADIMADKQIRRLPVIDQGKLVGIVAIGDLARVDIFTHESGHALSDISEPSQRPNAVQ